MWVWRYRSKIPEILLVWGEQAPILAPHFLEVRKLDTWVSYGTPKMLGIVVVSLGLFCAPQSGQDPFTPHTAICLHVHFSHCQGVVEFEGRMEFLDCSDFNFFLVSSLREKDRLNVVVWNARIEALSQATIQVVSFDCAALANIWL